MRRLNTLDIENANIEWRTRMPKKDDEEQATKQKTNEDEEKKPEELRTKK